MIKEEKNQINLKITKISGSDNIPELRFPEFVNEGEWDNEELRNLGEFLGGGTPERSNSDYWIGDIPWISSSDITEDDIHNISITRFINENAIKESATKIITKGSVLFVSRVGVGKLAINKKDVCTSQDFTNFLPKKNVFNFFIGYYFSSNKNLLQSLNQGTSIKGFSKSDLASFKLPYPKNLTEQQKIASSLSSLDEVIAAHSQKLELLKDHKKGLMQNLFPHPLTSSGGGSVAEPVEAKVPKLRFKEFENDGEWVEKKLEGLAKRGSGHTPNKQMSNYYNGGIKWVSLTDSNKLDNGYICDTKIKISKDGIENSSAVIHPAGTVILSRDAGVGKSALLFSEMAVSQHFIAWVCDDSKLYNWFLYYVLQILKPVFESIAVGSTIKTIGLPYFKELCILIPSIREQQKIAACLSSLDALIAAQAAKIEQLKLHKKGLMQGLFPKTV